MIEEIGKTLHPPSKAQECNSDLIFHNAFLVDLYFPLNSTLLTSTWTKSSVIESTFNARESLEKL
jgi:hypothetical protein